MGEIVRRLRGESHRMRDLVEDLLLLAHLDEGRPLRRDPVDLGALVRDLASDASVMHPGRRIDVVVDGGGSPRDTGSAGSRQVMGDELRLHQVIAGLLGNALVHTPESARIELCVWTDGSGAAAVTVRDDGPGVDAATAATLFDRFSRGDSSRSRSGGHSGFGLGLAIARSIVESHGGRLTLETAIGAGCAFTVVLPAAGEPSR
jgi:two-component system OmpR family sensor kinase